MSHSVAGARNTQQLLLVNVETSAGLQRSPTRYSVWKKLLQKFMKENSIEDLADANLSSRGNSEEQTWPRRGAPPLRWPLPGWARTWLQQLAEDAPGWEHATGTQPADSWRSRERSSCLLQLSSEWNWAHAALERRSFQPLPETPPTTTISSWSTGSWQQQKNELLSCSVTAVLKMW